MLSFDTAAATQPFDNTAPVLLSRCSDPRQSLGLFKEFAHFRSAALLRKMPPHSYVLLSNP